MYFLRMLGVSGCNAFISAGLAWSRSDNDRRVGASNDEDEDVDEEEAEKGKPGFVWK